MAAYGTYTDQELLSLLKVRNHAAYTELFNRYWSVLYLHAKKMLHNEDEAMDVVQDIFTVLWNRADDLSLATSLKSYLYTAVRNQVLKVLNRGKLKDKFIDNMTLVMTELVTFTDDQVSFNELEKLIEKEVANLPSQMRLIYTKHHIEGLSHKEIAEQLQLSEHTIKTTVYRAVHILRAKIAGLLSVLLLINKL
jgi:RNA polymerase sigma-70 factor (ECF subfamily)